MLAGNADVTLLVIQEYGTGSTNHVTDHAFLRNKLGILEYKNFRSLRYASLVRTFPVRARRVVENSWLVILYLRKYFLNFLGYGIS